MKIIISRSHQIKLITEDTLTLLNQVEPKNMIEIEGGGLYWMTGKNITFLWELF